MQRLRYKIARLEWMLETKDQRTLEAKAKVVEEFEQRKTTLRLKLEQESKKETRKQLQIRKTAEESQKVVAYLRRENKRLREKNHEIHLAILDLKAQNERLESANSVTDGTIGTLNDHTKTIEETHAKLMEVVPKYEESVATLNDAVQLRRQYGSTEHKIRLLYVKLMGDIVELLEGSTTEYALAEQAMQSILQLEEEELAKNRPMNPDEFLNASLNASAAFSHSDDDDDDLNDYKVHTMD
jgi:chromosome segregation ATPase